MSRHFASWAVVAGLSVSAGAWATTTVGSNFDGNMSLIYNTTNGAVFVENGPLPNPAVQGILIQSATGFLQPPNLTLPPQAPPVTILSNTPNLMNFQWTGGNFLGTGSSLGQILPPGMPLALMLSDLTIEWTKAPGIPAAGDLIHGTYGNMQSNPVLPLGPGNGFFRFFDVASGQFFDPPMTYGYTYEMTSASLFTSVGFPLGLGNDFTITSSEGVVPNLAEGSLHTFTGGVSSFSITGITPLVDGDDPAAFPVFLTFSTPTASFDMTALNIPEPGMGLVIGLGGALTLVRRRRAA